MSMTKKKIKLEDGRYLIYFTFGKENEEKQPGKITDGPGFETPDHHGGCGCKCCGGEK